MEILKNNHFMKTKILMLTLILCGTIYSQEKVVYDVDKNVFEINGKSIDESTALAKNREYKIYLKNYNPFVFSCSVEIKAKDDVKDLFQFISKLGKIDIAELIKIGSTYVDDQQTTKFFAITLTTVFDAFSDDYNSCYLIGKDLQVSTFDYNDLKSRFKNDEYTKLLDNYLKVKASVMQLDKSSKSVDEKMKSAGLPIQGDVEELALLMKELNLILKKYKDGNGAFYVGAFNTDSYTKINTKVLLAPKKEYVDSVQSISGTQNFRIKSFININFSSGIYMAWNPKIIYYSEQQSNGKYRINEETERRYLPGVGAFAHLFLNKKPEFGLVVGGGIDIEATPNVLLGISYKPVNSNIIISSGVGFSHQDRLSDSLMMGVDYDSKPEINQKKIMKSGFWIGLSYKL